MRSMVIVRCYLSGLLQIVQSTAKQLRCVGIEPVSDEFGRCQFGQLERTYEYAQMNISVAYLIHGISA